jgi:hypothetical protein
MYDVVKSKTVKGKVMLYCINDKKEKTLVDNYNIITKHNSSTDKKGKNIIDNSINFFVEVNEPSAIFNFIKSKSAFPSFISSLQSVTFQIISPPPQV